jgi:tetratricopeptide (TPR) repeat protein
MEFLMRLTPILISLGIAAATIASAGNSQRPDDQVDPRSAALVAQAQTRTGAGQYEQAIDLLETALAVDPGNRGAYIQLGRVAQAQRLPGKAIGYYADALRLEPNDVNALASQGEAYVQRGAVARGRQNQSRVQGLWAAPCPQAQQLASVIQRGPPAEVLAAQRPEQGAPPVTPPATPAPRPN